MRAATASGSLISALLWTLVSAVPGPATAEKIASQERVCQDVARPGTRIMDRVCGTSAEVRAYVRQDFYAKSSDPLLQSPSGGFALCWMFLKDGSWDKPCPAEQPTKPSTPDP
jgi:hypothetical protein